MFKYKIVFSYDGSHFFGSQKQLSLKTVEQSLIKNLLKYFKDLECFVMSSRTDKNVHAHNQVASFNSSISLNNEQIAKSLNNKNFYIKIKNIENVDSKFNARKSAKSREYIYLFTHTEIPVFLNNYISRVSNKIDLYEFNKLLNIFVGTHDFNAFRKTGSENNSTIRTIYSATIQKTEYKLLTESQKPIMIYEVKVKGNSFLYQMIRNLIGSILEILSNSSLNETDLLQLIEKKKKSFNFKPAPPYGLYLNKITY